MAREAGERPQGRREGRPRQHEDQQAQGRDQRDVALLDLACGTGRFLRETMRTAMEGADEIATVVWIAEGNGEERSVREQRVRTGLKFDGMVAVQDGLAAGTTVVTEGNEALQDGQTVRVTDSE